MDEVGVWTEVVVVGVEMEVEVAVEMLGETSGFVVVLGVEMIGEESCDGCKGVEMVEGGSCVGCIWGGDG